MTLPWSEFQLVTTRKFPGIMFHEYLATLTTREWDFDCLAGEWGVPRTSVCSNVDWCVWVFVCGCGECSLREEVGRANFTQSSSLTCVQVFGERSWSRRCTSFPKPPSLFVPWLSGPLRNHTNGNVLSWFGRANSVGTLSVHQIGGESHLLYQ